MTDIATPAWFAAGLLAGLVHATMLWRAAHRLTGWTPVVGMLRLVAVATVLIVAAVSGTVFATGAGWAAGFVVPGAWFVMSRASTPIRSSRGHSGD